jgi:hypothetical protein
LDKARKEIFVKAYLLTLLTTSLIVALIGYLTPEGERGGLSKHISLLSGLCLLCVLITPIAQAISGGGDLLGRLEGALDDWLDGGENSKEEYDDRWQEQYEQMDVRYAEAAISLMLQQKFEIAEGDVSVRLQLDDTGERIAAVQVGLSGRAVWINTHDLEAYIEQTLGCECTTYIESRRE